MPKAKLRAPGRCKQQWLWRLSAREGFRNALLRSPVLHAIRTGSIENTMKKQTTVVMAGARARYASFNFRIF
jgi:hypothetical protein